jgi:pyruvate/2-oxoglutarate dehydrogenase complex dihydrolipoamide dehydrogenase (E3) component
VKSRYDFCIVGAGPAGLAAAELAARHGLDVALIEAGRLGGDSLNSGSIPSKTLISAARAYLHRRAAEELDGAEAAQAPADFPAILTQLRTATSRAAVAFSAPRLAALGIDVLFGPARFVASQSLLVGGTEVAFSRALIATGARPRRSNIPGLEACGYRTSENIFDLTALPPRIAVIGGGALGCELAQAFCALGSRVSIVQREPKFLPIVERDAAELLSRALSRGGVEARLNTEVVAARTGPGGKLIDCANDEWRFPIEVDEILLSIGRVPNTAALGLEAAGIATEPEGGVRVDDFLCTTNSRVYAAGDVCLQAQFANAAAASARLAVGNAFAGAREPVSALLIPRCTYCTPEIAHVGLHLPEIRQRGIPVKTYVVMMADVDRAITDDLDDGFLKIHVQEGTDRILGATIVAAHASEMINEMSVVMNAGIGMRRLAGILHTYPTQSDAIRLAALAFVRDQPAERWQP